MPGNHLIIWPDGRARSLGSRVLSLCTRRLARDCGRPAWAIRLLFGEMTAQRGRLHGRDRKAGTRPPRAALHLGLQRTESTCATSVVARQQRSGAIDPEHVAHKIPLEELDAASTGTLIDEMADSIAALLTGLGSEGELRFARGVDVGYIGQSYQVTVPLDGEVDRDAIWERFATLYSEKYGYFYDDVPAEIVNLRVLGELVGGELGLEPLPVERGAAAVAAGTRPAWSARERRMRPFTVFDRDRLRPGMAFEGPAIVEEASATTIVDDGATVEVDAYGALVIAALPDGEYHEEMEMEIEGIAEPQTLAVTVRIEGSDVYADFAGTAPQVRRPVNCPINYTRAYVALPPTRAMSCVFGCRAAVGMATRLGVGGTGSKPISRPAT